MSDPGDSEATVMATDGRELGPMRGADALRDLLRREGSGTARIELRAVAENQGFLSGLLGSGGGDTPTGRIVTRIVAVKDHIVVDTEPEETIRQPDSLANYGVEANRWTFEPARLHLDGTTYEYDAGEFVRRSGDGRRGGRTEHRDRDEQPAPAPTSSAGQDGSPPGRAGAPPAGGSGPDSRRVPDTIPGLPDIGIAYDDLRHGERIGRGNTATVTAATVPGPEGSVEVAIKEPLAAGTLDRRMVERWLAEAETWDRLDGHDHVVDIAGYDSEPGPWIAMERMDGGHLGARAGKLTTVQALWTGIAITRGVRHAHRQGVAHLDLKPANVLFRAVEGAWDVPKVADWGLSKRLLEGSGGAEGLSPMYAAPEQFNEDAPVDERTDIYQLGATLYELFTGRPPFEGTPAEVRHGVLHEVPAPPSEIRDLPPELDELLLTALATDRADRYDDIVYLRDGLRELYEATASR
jgi:hypothetical protein